MNRLRSVSLLVVLALVALACGQKPGVHEEVTGGGGIVNTGGSGAVDPGTGGTIDTGDGAEAGGGTRDGGGTTGGRGAGPAAGGGGAGGGGTAALALQGSDQTGATSDQLSIGVHAPLTGAAPLPAVSFERGRDLYWRYLTEIKKEKVLGRSKVVINFADDRYTPSTAVQTCRELGSKSFLVVGAGGADGIQACGQFANQAKIPYLSFGVSESGLAGNGWYYAMGMTYPDQAPLLAQYVKKTFGNKKVAAVITDTPNFDDATAAWESAVKTQGLNYFKTMRHPQGTSSWITSYVRDLQQAGVQVLFMLMAPVFYIQFAQQASTQNYKPQFVGVGVTFGLNAVLASGCPHVDGAHVFSPWPGLDWARKNLPEFFSAGQRLGVPTDDIVLGLWGASRAMHEMLKRYEQTFKSTKLTREDFRNMLERQQGVQSGILPQLSYSADNHFGAKQVHVLKANCSNEQYTTLTSFASGF